VVSVKGVGPDKRRRPKLTDAKAMIAEIQRRHKAVCTKHAGEVQYLSDLCLAHDLACELQKAKQELRAAAKNIGGWLKENRSLYGVKRELEDDIKALRQRVVELEKADWKRQHPLASDASNSTDSFKVEDDCSGAKTGKPASDSQG